MSERYPSESRLHDAQSRARKANKILAILDDFLSGDLAERKLLDIGCARGLITTNLAPHFAFTLGVDVEQDEVAHAGRQSMNTSLALGVADAGRLPCADASFDVAVCAQVYEHVSDQPALFAEVWRVLRPGGICFFSGPNRLAPIEDHYGLPLLSWLPRPVSDQVLRLTGRGERYLEQPRTYWTLRSLVQRFEVIDYTAEILRSSERYSCSREVGGFRLLRYCPPGIFQLLRPFVPNYNWILRKRDA
jgi:SAM-dependent methyltransferase